MDDSSVSAWADELDSRDVKRRLQALEALGAALESRPWSQRPSGSATHERQAGGHDDASWQQIVAPLVRALRDNNFKVCRASLACLETLVGRVTEMESGRRAASGNGGGGGGGGGHAHSITPFLSLITPAVVECLGNAKAAVQAKGIDLLLAISDPAVAGAHDTVCSLEQHFAGHRNWRVRQRLVAYLGRVADVDPVGINEIQQQQQHQRGGGAVAGEEESSLLAGVLAGALNDSSSQVRQEALAAAAMVAKKLTGNGGPILLAQLEAKGVRRAALSALREATNSSGGGATDDNQVGTPSSSAAAAANLLSPVTPASSSSSSSVFGTGATTAHRGPGHGSTKAGAAAAAANGGGGAGGRLTAATRRRRHAAAGGAAGRGGVGATSVLTRTGGGVTEGVARTPTGATAAGGRGAGRTGGGGGRPVSPTNGVLLGGSPRGGVLAGGSGGGGEESAFSALEPLVPVAVYTERDVRREVEAAKTGLEHGSDWQKWVSAMRRLAGVALGGGGSEFPGLLVGLVRASVHEMVGHKVSENRSAVAREACRCVAVLARCLTDHFGALAELWLPELLRNTTRAVVVAAAGDEAARAVFGCTKDGFPRLLPYLVDTSKNKSAAIRRRCLDYAMLALARWNDAAFDRHVGQIRDMVTAAIGDADSSVRATARRAHWVLRLRFPDFAEAVMNSLAASMQRHVLREDQEFDAEAFVRAAEAAAEEPQPALGEHPEDLGGDDRDVKNIATTPGPTDTSASDRNPQASISSSSSAAGSAARRVHGTHHLSQPPQRRPGAALFSAGAAAAESSGGGATGGGAVRPASARVRVDRAAAGSSGGLGGGGGSGARAVRVGGGAHARRTRPGRPMAEGTSWTENGAADTSSFSDASSAVDGEGDGGGSGDGNRSRNAGVSALRVAGAAATASGGEGAVAAAAAKQGAFRVPRAGGNATSGSANESTRVLGGGGGGGGDAAPHRSPATRVVARRSSVATHAGGEAGPQQGFGVSGTVGGVSKAGRGAPSMRVVGRQQQQQQQQAQQRLDVGKSGRRGEEAGERGAEGAAMRAVVAEAVVLDRREVLRQMDDLADQAGESHWATRTEALERLLHLLTTNGGGGGGGGGGTGTDAGGAGGEGGRFVLESRSASRRLEAVIADRAKDTNFRVVAAALKLLGGLVEAQPALMAGHASALLPSVFPNLADTKEPVRQAANGVLDACRAAFPPHQLCSSLCPRVLELPPGRARTGLLEFLAVLVPHSASYFIQEANPAGEGAGGGGHLHSLTQRVAAALVQTPPPANWDGGLGDDGRPASAGPGASAAIRLLTALFRLDGGGAALTAASAGLPPESAAAVRRALSFCRSRSPSPSPSQSSSSSAPAGTMAAAAAAGGGGGAPSPMTTAEQVQRGAVAAGGERGEVCGGGAAAAAVGAGGVRAEVVGEVEVRSRSAGNKENQQRVSSFSPSPPRSPLRIPLPSPSVSAGSPRGGSAEGRLSPTTPGSVFSRGEGSGLGSTLFAPLPELQQQQPRRQALAPFTPSDLNRHPADGSGGGTGPRFRSKTGGKIGSKNQPVGAVCSTESSVVDASAASTTPAKPRAATMEVVAGRLIAGLSRGARSHRKVEALSSLRGLADGEGVGGYPDFWPRYFVQVLTLLLDGAAAAGGRSGGSNGGGRAAGESALRRGGEGVGEDGSRQRGGGGGGVSSSPSRRRALLRVKYLQGVRCLVARRESLFPACAETVIGRLVEIGGREPCFAARCEAEACLADLVGALEPTRYLAVLTRLLTVLTTIDGGDESGDGSKAAGGAGTAAQGGVPAQQQCVVLGALRALTSRLSSPGLLGALGAGSLVAGIEAALVGRSLEARKGAVMALVEMYQVLEEALLPFLANFPTSRLKLITMYIEKRRAGDDRSASAVARASSTNGGTPLSGLARMKFGGGGETEAVGEVVGAAVSAASVTRFTPMR